jgi:hypothetical protein
MRFLLAPGLLAAGVILGACTPDARQPVVSGPAVCDTSMRFVNNSSNTVLSLHYSPSSVSGWGPDRLGQNVMRPGQSSAVRLANPGNYDFRVVWDNGRSAEVRQVNVCRAGQITVTNAGLRVL